MRPRSKLVVLLITAVAAVGALTAGSSIAPVAARSATKRAASATYASVTGLVPLPQACGSRSPAYALGGMYEAKTLGVTQVRCDLSWWTVQPVSAQKYDWTVYDNAVNAAAHFGIKLLFTVGFTPPWARPNPLPPGTLDPSHVPPVRRGDFSKFMRAAVNRYSPVGKARVPSVVGSVNAWEIWNEPNIAGGWNPVDPVAYGQFLAAVAVDVHQIDPHATVIMGGLAPAVTAKGNYSPPDFVNKVGTTAALKRIDAIGLHPYTFPAYPDEKISFNPLYQMVPQLYYVMVANGIWNKKIWATEIGWPTASQSPQTLRPWDHIQVGTEAYQAKELPPTLVTWFKMPFAGPAFVYDERDSCNNNTSWLCKLGLERLDGSKKPAWTTVHAQLAKTIQP